MGCPDGNIPPIGFVFHLKRANLVNFSVLINLHFTFAKYFQFRVVANYHFLIMNNFNSLVIAHIHLYVVCAFQVIKPPLGGFEVCMIVDRYFWFFPFLYLFSFDAGLPSWVVVNFGAFIPIMEALAGSGYGGIQSAL